MGAARFIAGLTAAFAAFLAPTATALANPAEIIGEKDYKPRVIELTISTPAFAEPTKVDVNLPVGYDAAADKRWPVTYALAGTMNTYRSFNTVVDGVELTKNYPSIVVSPNGDSGYWSDWYNGGAGGPPMYETYVIDQLIPLIDQRFRTIPDRSHRLILGISMGGYGSMMMAARHPDLFAAAASISGADDSNLPPLAAALSASPTFQGGQIDAIYGPRAAQEVRWRGHNPTDLAGNLRGLDLQVRTANGTLNPAIGEDPLSADSVSCVVEAGVYAGSTSFHNELTSLGVSHLWKDYGDGCHTRPNFIRELVDTFATFKKVLADPPTAPRTFDYDSIEPDFDVYGWRVTADPKRALEFLRLRDAGDAGLTLVGSGTTDVTSPPLFRGLRRVDLVGAEEANAVPDERGRIGFEADLGDPNAAQQYTLGATTRTTRRAIRFEPWAAVKAMRAHVRRRAVLVCARAIGGTVAARVRLLGPGKRRLTRALRMDLDGATRCARIRLTREPTSRRAKLEIKGRDAFGHPVNATRKVRLRRQAG